MKRAFLKARGVTMVELTVTIGIVALLAALGVPSLRKNIMRAHSRDAMANLQLIHDANMIRVNRGDGSFTCAVTPCTPAELKSLGGTEILYLVTQGTFFFCDGSKCTACDGTTGDCSADTTITYTACIVLTTDVDKKVVAATATPVCEPNKVGACPGPTGTCS